MAHSLDYTPPEAQTRQTAEEEWDDVLETLHEAGALRVLNGLAGQGEGIAEVALHQLLNTPSGRNAIENLAVAFNGVAALEPDDLDVVRAGAGEGLQAARRSFEDDDPPGLVRLLTRLRDPDVRRGLSALLGFLKAFGGHLHENLNDERGVPARRD